MTAATAEVATTAWSAMDAVLSLKAAIGVSIATVIAGGASLATDASPILPLCGLIISIILCVIQIKKFKLEKEKHEIFKREEDQEHVERQLKIELLKAELQKQKDQGS